MNAHTKEPWKQRGTCVYLGRNEGGFDIRDCPNPEANARRIVACVNACAGIPTELIEQGGFAAIPVSTHRDVVQQRDELLAALKAYQRAGYGNSTDFRLQGEAYDMSVAAIEKAEKQLAQNAD